MPAVSTPMLASDVDLDVFSNPFSRDQFLSKYSMNRKERWADTARRVVHNVCDGLVTNDEKNALLDLVVQRKFIPAGRYLYAAGRPLHQYNNCTLFRAEDSREGWAEAAHSTFMALMTGAGIGIDYSAVRPEGATIARTGGKATGPVALMKAINEIGRQVMQGGSRRSAIWAGLAWDHADVFSFLRLKDWPQWAREKKLEDLTFELPMELTNVSIIYDKAFFDAYANNDPHAREVWKLNCKQAFQTAEPGFSINYKNPRESLRNAPVSADTWVLTGSGYVQVRDIIDTPVGVWTGKQWAKTTFKKTKENVQTVVVHMSGSRTIKADPTHEFKVERYEGKGKQRRCTIESVPAGDLQPGDTLHVSLPREGGSCSFVDRQQDKSAYTLGFLYGDGHFNNRWPDRAEVSICCPEKQVCREGFDAEMVQSETERDGRGYTRIYLKSDKLCGWQKGRIDTRGWVGRAKASFVAGLFDADGNWEPKQRRLRLGASDKSALEDVRRILEGLGIQANVSKNGSSGYTGESDCWQLVVSASYVSRFAEVIPTLRLKPEGYEPYRASTVKVCSVEEGPVEDVYCCDVGVEEHTFCAEGVIISNCCEVVSEDDSDKCNLGTLWLNRFETRSAFAEAVRLASLFLLCGGIRSDVPTEKIRAVGDRNNRIGLGIGGLHEWLMLRGSDYEVTPDMHRWLETYRDMSDEYAESYARRLNVNPPKGKRAIAPNGTIGLIAETTTGIEPLFCAAYKRRYYVDKKWQYQYVVDGAVKRLLDRNVPLEVIERNDAYALSFEQRVRFQADVQDYVDMSISSTCNMPAWGTEGNHYGNVAAKADILLQYAPRLRGFTVYPDGARGGQPLTKVSVAEAQDKEGTVYVEEARECTNGVCGI